MPPQDESRSREPRENEPDATPGAAPSSVPSAAPGAIPSAAPGSPAGAVPGSDVEGPISWLGVPDSADLREDVATLFAKAEEKVEHVPNVFRAFSLTPEHFLRWFRYYDFLMRNEASALSLAEREMIGLVVSAENRCEYCLGAHSAALRDLIDDHVKADVITHNYRRADLTERERALLDFAVALTVDSHEMTKDDLEPLRNAGLDDETIFEAAQVAAMFNFTNRLANGLGWKPNRRYYFDQRP